MSNLFSKSSAILSECRKYRYFLSRIWGDGGKYLGWVMLNPSTADSDIDDPTIRRCIRFSRRWGYDGLIVLNLFAFRTPLPDNLRKTPCPVSEPNDFGRNNRFIQWFSNKCVLMVAAWGRRGKLMNRDKIFVDEVLSGIQLYCLGRNSDGTPKHPLYCRGDLGLVEYP